MFRAKPLSATVHLIWCGLPRLLRCRCGKLWGPLRCQHQLGAGRHMSCALAQRKSGCLDLTADALWWQLLTPRRWTGTDTWAVA
jgi:hypothetical protein